MVRLKFLSQKAIKNKRGLIFLIVMIALVPLILFSLSLRPTVRHLNLSERDRIFISDDNWKITNLFRFHRGIYRLNVHHYSLGQLVKRESVGYFGNFDVNNQLLAFRLDLNASSTDQAQLTLYPPITAPIYFDIENNSIRGFPASGAIRDNFRLRLATGEEGVIAIYQIGTTRSNLTNAYIDLSLDYLKDFNFVDDVIFISVERVISAY